MKRLILILILTLAIYGLWTMDYGLCSNVAVSNVVLQNKDLGAGTVEIKFDLAQENTFTGTDDNSQVFYDRVWIFVKYWLNTDSESTGWHHATIVSGGTVTPASDGKGAFCQVGANQTVKWDYGVDGVSGSATIKACLNAIEMVYIPQGAFVYNVGSIGGAGSNNYGDGSQVTVSSAAHIPAGCGAGWPNGYSAFYIMKYEVSQGQYADYLNMLDAANAAARFPNYNGSDRYTIGYTAGNSYGSRYAATSVNRACNYLNWGDATAFASWCALRPMTEMEFEKAARGGGAGTRKYPWGDNDPSTAAYAFDGATITSGYCLFNNISAGPVNVGHYLSGDITRSNAETGASPYGVTDMSGNNWEHLINCAHTAVPANGSGTVACPASWPGSVNKGVRGGGWLYTVADGYLRVSDRSCAGWTGAGRFHDVGVRFARTSP